ncbi:hypothetical protein [Demequina iriomotensis]|uniref:hypothetical protein n=1 Tax=Demequina iriomotensis TaxID=1536641 RepID=UPI000784BE93|nr:hypothetical protein [Demequina iriomotensis]
MPATELPGGARVRSVWDDAIERDGQMLVLAGNEVSLLSPVATALVHAARDGITLDALGARLVEDFGAPEGRDPGEVLREFVTALVQRGVIVIEG